MISRSSSMSAGDRWLPGSSVTWFARGGSGCTSACTMAVSACL
jgi:hypothetical protein